MFQASDIRCLFLWMKKIEIKGRSRKDGLKLKEGREWQGERKELENKMKCGLKQQLTMFICRGLQ